MGKKEKKQIAFFVFIDWKKCCCDVIFTCSNTLVEIKIKGCNPYGAKLKNASFHILCIYSSLRKIDILHVEQTNF